MSLVLIGAGPGIGLAVAKLFVSKRFSKVALLARSQDKLDDAREAVTKAASSNQNGLVVKTYAIDIADDKALLKALEKVQSDLGQPECVYFNAARVQPSSFFDVSLEEMGQDFKITTNALYVTAKWAIPLLNQAQQPALLVTSGTVYIKPETSFVSLTVTKTAQRSLVMTLDKQFGKEVHIGLIAVDGVVKPENKRLNPTYIAERAWELYDQEKGHWELEITITEE